jgi:hypothetical protein
LVIVRRSERGESVLPLVSLASNRELGKEKADWDERLHESSQRRCPSAGLAGRHGGHPALAGFNLYDEPKSCLFGVLGHARRERLLFAGEGLPTILWVVLILGGVITVCFTYLFGLENTLVHLLMVAALAMIISLSLFTVAALDYPFKGDIRIHPAAYEQDLERFRESKLSDL